MSNKTDLLQKFIENRISDSEMELLFLLINSPKGEVELLQSLDEAYESHEQDISVLPSDVFPKIRRKIEATHKKKIRIRNFIAIAASVSILIGTSIAFYSADQTIQKEYSLRLPRLLQSEGNYQGSYCPIVLYFG